MTDDKYIEKAAELFKTLGLTEIQIKSGEFEISMKKEEAPKITASPISVPVSTTGQYTESAVNKADATDEKSEKNDDGCLIVKNPILGTFYSSPSPDSAPYVKIGDKVKKGDILCIIEAMKTMNEIASEYDGRIVDICAQDGVLAEFGQTLFKISTDA